jgi:aminoglycoside-2''-adenylyltransferase
VRWRWQPLELDALAALFAGVRTPWWIAGGHALELFCGRSWREHGDVDAGILRRDQAEVFAALDAWEIHTAHEGKLRLLAPGELAEPEVVGLWCRRQGEEPWRFEILLDSAEGSDWLFRRAPAIRRPLASLIRRTADGLPYLAPEIQLLYKARDTRPRDEQDFAEAAPALDGSARDWLRDALDKTDPGHPWSRALSR